MPLRKPGFQLDTFEYVTASADSVLLRVAGQWTREPGACDVVAKTRAGALTLEALPQPPLAGDVWRAGFSAEPWLVETDDVQFQLRTTTGARITLPRPVERGARPRGKTRSRRRPPRRFARAGRATGALARERAAREAAERDARHERDRFLALLQSNAEERERLETALQRTATRAATRTSAAEASERSAREEADGLRERVVQLEGIVGRLVVGVEEGEKRLAEAEQRGHDLRTAIQQAERERPEVPDVSAVRDLLDRRLERLAHLERQARAVRAAIYERLAAAPSDPGQEQLFDAPVERTPVPA